MEEGTLVHGSAVPRAMLDRIVARAGIPPRVLDEINVEHEISCDRDVPLWLITWSDLRLVGDEDPDAEIERARRRFLAIHQSVIEHNAQERHVHRAANGQRRISARHDQGSARGESPSEGPRPAPD